jgi:hypothetical protein
LFTGVPAPGGGVCRAAVEYARSGKWRSSGRFRFAESEASSGPTVSQMVAKQAIVGSTVGAGDASICALSYPPARDRRPAKSMGATSEANAALSLALGAPHVLSR